MLSKSAFSREMTKPWFFGAFKVFISYIFPESFIENHEFVQKIRNFSSLILAISVSFLDFFHFLVTKGNGVII